MTRLRSLGYWLTPALVTLIVYWPGLLAWFQKDDFAWLQLHNMVENGEGLTTALFHPFAQGTIRTLSERVFFLGFYELFGTDALPYRCLGFLTHFANLALIAIVCRKLTGSRVAGFWAAMLYTLNSVLAVPLSWTCIYYEILCTFCFLLNLWLSIRYAETGRGLYWLWMWCLFLLGFGVLELNVVYPAIALLWALCCARQLIWRVLPLFIPSGVYTVIHFAVTTPAHDGPYKMFWDLSMAKTLWTYFAWSLGPSRLWLLGIPPSFLRSAATVLLIAGLLGFLCWKLWKREWVVAVFPGWFFIVLLPLLPLRDHLSEYYLTIPVVGLAMLGGWAIATGLQSQWKVKAATVVLAALYIAVSVPVGYTTSKSFYDRSKRMESLVEGVAALHEVHPKKEIVLKNAEAEMIRSAIYHNPFRIYGFGQAYLVPEDEAAFRSDAMYGVMKERFMDAAQLRQLIASQRAAVYDVRDERPVDVTATYH